MKPSTHQLPMLSDGLGGFGSFYHLEKSFHSENTSLLHKKQSKTILHPSRASGVRSSQALGDMGTTPHQTQAVGKSTLTHGSHSILANARAENVTLEYHFEWLWEQTQHSFSTLIQQMI